jgi:hypothetical protein
MARLHPKARLLLQLVPLLGLAGCVSGGAVQPDRSIFALDGNYQRYQFSFPIEDTFDRTARVFKEAGYRLDVVDRATGQISGQRTKGRDSSATDKGQKFYALVMPVGEAQSQVAVKIVQIIRQGALVSTARTEIIVNDGQMYQYLFRRIADAAIKPDGAELPAPDAARRTPALPAQPAQPTLPR